MSAAVRTNQIREKIGVMHQGQKRKRHAGRTVPTIGATVLLCGLLACVLEPEATWVLSQADIVALEVRLVGDTNRLAGNDFPPVDDTVSVQSGSTLNLVAISRGSSSCRRGDLFETAVNGDNLVITLIDSVLTGQNVACTDDLAPLYRNLTHVLMNPGSATVTVLGNPPARVSFNVTP